jgi:hypothetical protein
VANNDRSPPNSPVPNGWIPVGRPHDAGFEHNSYYFKLALIRLSERLIDDVRAAGIPQEEAVAIVEHNLIGVKQPRTGRSGLYASPEAIEMLRHQEAKEIAPDAPKTWKSATQLMKLYYINNASNRNQSFVNLRDRLVHDIKAAGILEEEAVAIVDQNLIGRKKPISGREALHASPDAIRILEDTGKVRPRWTDKGPRHKGNGASRDHS